MAPKAILGWKNRFFLFRGTLECVIITYSRELMLNTILHLHYGLCLQAVTVKSNEMRPKISANSSLQKMGGEDSRERNAIKVPCQMENNILNAKGI